MMEMLLDLEENKHDLFFFHDNIFPQQSMFLMRLSDLISNSHSLSLHPLDLTVETICQETKSFKDA